MQGSEEVEFLISRMRKIARDYTALGHIVSYNNAECISNVPFFEVCRLVALELVIGDELRIYVLQLHILAEYYTARIACCDELRTYVQKLLILAEYHAPISPISDKLHRYVQRFLILAEHHTSRIAISYGLL